MHKLNKEKKIARAWLDNWRECNCTLFNKLSEDLKKLTFSNSTVNNKYSNYYYWNKVIRIVWIVKRCIVVKMSLSLSTEILTKQFFFHLKVRSKHNIWWIPSFLPCLVNLDFCFSWTCVWTCVSWRMKQVTNADTWGYDWVINYTNLPDHI